jgi:hypothetical protein
MILKDKNTFEMTMLILFLSGGVGRMDSQVSRPMITAFLEKVKCCEPSIIAEPGAEINLLPEPEP